MLSRRLVALLCLLLLIPVASFGAPHQATAAAHTTLKKRPATPPRPLPLPPIPPAPAQQTQVAPPKPEYDPNKGTVTGLPIPRYASLRADVVNLRAGPGARYPIDWVTAGLECRWTCGVRCLAFGRTSRRREGLDARGDTDRPAGFLHSEPAGYVAGRSERRRACRGRSAAGRDWAHQKLRSGGGMVPRTSGRLQRLAAALRDVGRSAGRRSARYGSCVVPARHRGPLRGPRSDMG